MASIKFDFLKEEIMASIKKFLDSPYFVDGADKLMKSVKYSSTKLSIAVGKLQDQLY